MQDHDVLGVRPGATHQEVTDAFRRFALAHHPDRGGDPGRFQAGVHAYQRLTGPRPSAGSSSATSDAHEIVFHRRTRPRVSNLLRVAGRRLTAFRSHP